MIMKKKLTAFVFAAVLAGGLLTGCGGKEEAPQAAGTGDTPQASAKGVITVAASPAPHAEILEAAKPILAEQGWDLQIKVFNDYVLPNEVVESGDFDCNYFQHTPYLDSFNEEKGTHLVNIGEIHYEPLGIYPGTQTSLESIEDGAVIAVPNDTTNEARALLLLQDKGLLKLKEGAGMTATVNDIEENPHNIKFQEMEAAQIPRVLPEVAFGVINGNYALQAGLNVETDAIAYETADSDATGVYVNIIAVKEGNEGSEGVKALVEVLKSDDMKQFMNDKYKGCVVPF